MLGNVVGADPEFCSSQSSFPAGSPDVPFRQKRQTAHLISLYSTVPVQSRLDPAPSPLYFQGIHIVKGPRVRTRAAPWNLLSLPLYRPGPREIKCGTPQRCRTFFFFHSSFLSCPSKVDPQVFLMVPINWSLPPLKPSWGHIFFFFLC